MNRIVTTGWIFIFLLGNCLSLQAQTWGLEYTGELQTGFNGKSCFANLLRLNFDYELNDHVKFSAATLSIAHSLEGRVLDDMQVFTNLDADNQTLAPTIAGVEWSINDNHSLFVGIRDVSADYFTSPVTSLFTNSSAGIFPTVSCIQQIANYPLAGMGLHYNYQREAVEMMASLYNGVGRDHFSGHDNVWRVDPRCDGLFAMSQGGYTLGESRYYLGACLHTGTSEAREVRSAVWGYAEQEISSSFSLIASYSHAFGNGLDCSEFVSLGGRYAAGRSTIGLYGDYAQFNQQGEFATELTYRYDFSSIIYIQAAYHLIQNGSWHSAALVRLGVTL